LFPKEAIYYFCKPNIPRGLDAVVLQKKATEFNLKGNVYNSVTTAYETAANNAANDDLHYGSTFCSS
jgi:dihydrofolate synthase/folylpolyglutamate synthase